MLLGIISGIIKVTISNPEDQNYDIWSDDVNFYLIF